MDVIEIFKTNVHDAEKSKLLINELVEHFPGSAISFDLEDCDKILRIKSKLICVEKIISILNSKGYKCEQLI